MAGASGLTPRTLSHGTSTLWHGPQGLRADRGPATAAPIGTPPTRVRQTIDLFTGALLPGNRSPANWSAWENPPFDAVVDPHDGTLLADGTSGGSRLLQIATGRVLGVAGAGGFGAFDPGRRLFYVPGGGAVAVLSGSSGRVLATIPTGSSTMAAAYDGRTDEVYTTNPSTNNVSVINVSTDRTVASFAVPGGPSLEAFDNATGWLYVATDGNITVVNTTTGRILGRVSDPFGPCGIAIDPRNDQVWVANAFFQNITIINGTDHRYLRDTASNGVSSGIGFDPINGRFYITDFSANVLTVMNGSTDRTLGFLSVGPNRAGVAYDALTRTLYVTSFYSMALETLSPTAHLLRGSLGPLAIHPTAAAFDPPRDWVFIVNQGAGNVTILNATTGRFVRSAAVGAGAVAALYDPDNREIYVANSESSSLTVLNGSTGAAVRSISVGLDPVSLAVDPATGNVFVANAGYGPVSVLDDRTDRVVRNLYVPSGTPDGLAVDAAHARLFVGTLWPGTAPTAIAEVGIGNWTNYGNLSLGANWSTSDLTFDPATSELFVAEENWTGTAGVAAINSWTGKVDRWLPVTSGTVLLDLDASRGVLLVTGEIADQIDQIDLATLGLLAPVAVGAYTSGSAVDSITGVAFVGEPNRGLVAVL